MPQQDLQVSGCSSTVEASLDLPSLPEPALTLRDLDRAIQIPHARPPEVDFRALDPGSYGIGLPRGEPTRVTTDSGTFESHPTISNCSPLIRGFWGGHQRPGCRWRCGRCNGLNVSLDAQLVADVKAIAAASRWVA